MRLRALAVAHQPVKHAFNFAFAADGQRAIFSDNAAYRPALIAAARGAEFLVHE